MKQRSAFTLMEILIVMILIGFLISITTVMFGDSDKAKKVLAMQNEMRNINSAIGQYKNTMGATPLDLSAVIFGGPCNSKNTDMTPVWNDSFYAPNQQLSGITAVAAGTDATGACSSFYGVGGDFADTADLSTGIFTESTAATSTDISGGGTENYVDLFVEDDSDPTDLVEGGGNTIVIGIGKRQVIKSGNRKVCYVGPMATTSVPEYIDYLRDAAAKMMNIAKIDLANDGSNDQIMVDGKVHYIEKQNNKQGEANSATLFVPSSKISCAKYF